MEFTRRASLAALSITAVAAMACGAQAQTPEQFYKGKNINFTIGYPPGGSNDVWGRLIARHIGKHIPGKPNVVPMNQPGAGSFLALNTVYTR